MRESVYIETVMNAANDAAHLMGGVFDEIAAAGFERLRIHPYDARTKASGHARDEQRGYDHVATADIDFVLETDRYGLRSVCGRKIAIVGHDSLNARMTPCGQREHKI